MIIPILMYHSIGSSKNNLTVSIDNFERQMSFMKRNNYKSISFKNSNAYWLNTDGQIYDVPMTHIQVVIANPNRYNLTLEYIKSIYNKFNEPMNFEGYARKEIMMKMIKEFDWIRLRKIIRNGLWQGNVKSFEPLYMNTLKKWLSIMVDKKYTYGTDEILVSCEFERVSDFKKIVNENNTTNIQVTINEFLKTDF